MDKKIYEKAMKCQKSWNRSQRLITMLTKKPIPKSIEYMKAVPYSDGEREVMNIFCQKDAKKKRPLFIYVHGGGWLSGEIDMRNSYVCEFAKLGFFAVSVDYTLSPQAVYPTQIQQCFKAVDYLYDNAEKYNIDTDNVLIAGESAGVHYIMHMVACCKDKSLYDKIGIDFNHKNEFDIKAVISHSGAVSIDNFCNQQKPQSKIPNIDISMQGYLGKNEKELDEWLKTDEARYATPKITEAFPPMFFAWAKNDGYRFDTFDMINDAEKHNVKFTQFEGKGILSNHAFSIMMCFKGSKKCLDETLDFILPSFYDYFCKDNGWKIKE
ncbi:alpha/beta hydrolase [uncultured Eubacterium sp.]|uniref:alpha/beta hydrolase n=1 Tax=uncultured Eubacterium sp. TaxID=165185 RepID=UPI0015BB1A9D|nr:alpha/beta hydrolase [uncultured Eubacterium sp.]